MANRALAAALPGQNSFARRYPPLALFGLAILIVAVILPSALNLPQSNPSTVLEYAPVPPEESDKPPPSGNVASLGLAGSATLQQAAAPKISGAAGARPSTKRCIGSPARQSADPNAPPCVAFFQGDNGGATYQGVTADEIKAVVYMDGTSSSNQSSYGTPAEIAPNEGQYCDVDAPPNTGGPACYINGASRDHLWVRITRVMSKFFNDRFQTYNRHVHFYMYWSGATAGSGRRADGADNFQKHQPFTAVDQAVFQGFNDVYADAMARRRVLLFSSYTGNAASFFQQYAPQVWGFPPDIEHWEQAYVSYVCKKVAPYRVSHAQNGLGLNGQPLNGRPRKYALMWADDPGEPGLKHFRNLALEDLKKCGVVPAVEVTFPDAGWAVDTVGDSSYAATNIAAMRQADATTILWLGGMETKTGNAADAARYYPEVVVAGDGTLDSRFGGQLQNQNFWRNAWSVSYQLRVNRLDDSPGFQACKEVDPNMSRDDCGWADQIYRDHFMLFLGIQVAGPQLTPETVDEGMHAIPPTTSTSPYVASCYFDPIDWTCVKDFKEQWWDPSRKNPNPSGSTGEGPGCWALPRGGQRFSSGSWAGADDVFINGASDPCDGYSSSVALQLGAPQPPGG